MIGRAIWIHTQRGEPQPGLLHNMSVPSKTVVSYSGLAGLVDAARAGGTEVRRAGAGNAGIFGRHLRFALPETVPTHDPALLLQTLRHRGGRGISLLQRLLGGAAAIDPSVDPMCELEHLIEARARELPLPDACLVVRADPTHPCRLPDALSALAVLAKCSEHVWLREKRPNLSRLATCREVSLLLPPQFSDRLQEFLSP